LDGTCPSRYQRQRDTWLHGLLAVAVTFAMKNLSENLMAGLTVNTPPALTGGVFTVVRAQAIRVFLSSDAPYYIVRKMFNSGAEACLS
jgi:hypothetical protein